MRDYDVTSAGISAEQDRQHRMKVYFIMMSIRMVCVASLLFVRGWWIILVIIGGVFLPYLAVVFANQPNYRATQGPEKPEQEALEGAATKISPTDIPLFVVDDPDSRRASPTASGDADLPEYTATTLNPEDGFITERVSDPDSEPRDAS